MPKGKTFKVDQSLHARRDRSVWRVWRGDWADDAFETLELDDFNKFSGYLRKFGIEIEVHDD